MKPPQFTTDPGEEEDDGHGPGVPDDDGWILRKLKEGKDANRPPESGDRRGRRAARKSVSRPSRAKPRKKTGRGD
jgi:hypothetical protein